MLRRPRLARALCAAAARPAVHAVPLRLATPEALAPYGTVFTDWDAERCRLQRWPARGWRPVAAGDEAGCTSGSFTLAWSHGAHAASNSAVAHGDYVFAWSTRDAALAAAASPAPPSPPSNGSSPSPPSPSSPASADASGRGEHAYLWSEINYHACGSQLFFTPDAAVLLLLALPPPHRAPDDVRPDDFRAFYCPAGLGVNVDAFVWHSPPIATTDGQVAMRTRQARVHSKIYYDPLQEHGVLLQVPLREPSG
ncbi:hypothetical protein AB1Y20_010822 [Prymnesium parvum]|uniref:Beta-galactosidase n=1 Tax=Prymnesium parvum TaxID=97485 RepID=A0AB34ISL1_PRYPA